MRGDAGARLTSRVVVHSIGGAICWALALVTLEDRPLASFGASLAALQLCTLIGGAGLPVVVYCYARSVVAPSVQALALVVALLGGTTAWSLIALGSPPTAVGWPVLLALGPVASLAVVVDAVLVAEGRWASALARVVAAVSLRGALVLAAAVTSSEAIAVLAALAPDAGTAAVVLLRRGLRTTGKVTCPPGVARFLTAQYVSASLTFLPLLSVPVILAARLEADHLAVLLPGWAVLATVVSAAHASASGVLLDPSAGAGSARRWTARWTGIFAALALLSGAVAASLDLVGAPTRWSGAALTGAVLVGVSAPWPVLARGLAVARLRSRNVAAILIVAPMSFAPASLALGGPTSPIWLASTWAGGIALGALAARPAVSRVVA